MRSNRKISGKMSRMTVYALHFLGVFAAALVVVIFNQLASTMCTQLMKRVADCDARLAAEEGELERATAMWDAMKSSDNLGRALDKRGLALRYPDPNSQIIRMDVAGRPLPGQNSVAMARQRHGMETTASIGVRRRGKVR